MSRQVRLSRSSSTPQPDLVGEDLSVEESVFSQDLDGFLLENPQVAEEFAALAQASARARRARTQQ